MTMNKVMVSSVELTTSKLNSGWRVKIKSKVAQWRAAVPEPGVLVG